MFLQKKNIIKMMFYKVDYLLLVHHLAGTITAEVMILLTKVI